MYDKKDQKAVVIIVLHPRVQLLTIFKSSTLKEKFLVEKR